MEAELTRLGKSLVLTEDEDLGAVMPAGLWHSDQDNGGFHVVGRVLSHKPYNVEALRSILHSLLNPTKGMVITFIENGRFLLKFNHTLDRDRALVTRSWAFDKNLIISAKVAECDNPAEVDLTWCEFQVRIHGLPLGEMTPAIAQFIGGKIGRLLESDQTKDPKSWGSFMRLRIAIDVTKPLPRALKIRTVLGDDHIVTFTYEWLPNFCYLCGRIGHISQWCESRFQPDFVDPSDNSPYGPWLRALGRADSRTRFPHNTFQHSQAQLLWPRFCSRQSDFSASSTNSKRGSAIYGEFPISEQPTGMLFPTPASAPCSVTTDHTENPTSAPVLSPDILSHNPHLSMSPQTTKPKSSTPLPFPEPQKSYETPIYPLSTSPPLSTHNLPLPQPLPTLPETLLTYPPPGPILSKPPPPAAPQKRKYTKKTRPTGEPTPNPNPTTLSKCKLVDEESPSDLLPCPKKPNRSDRTLTDISNILVEAAPQPHQGP
ncbi:UNVERIFIED_CONTAM: hypothetical protein Slati_1969400 [Sesamum latifolium]|uniref:CCHC-type domain-containing protein n=1 Tax=Sesamum latifolium TaxID=2727402 RepID=A0AAW2WKY8_9LAMI